MCLKQQTFTFYCTGEWEIQTKVPAYTDSGESTLPGLKMVSFSLYSHMMQWKIFLSSYKITVLSDEGPTDMI